MGHGDHMPSGGHKKKYDPAYAKKIKEGGAKADAIHKEREVHHAKHELPKAEEELNIELENL